MADLVEPAGPAAEEASGRYLAGRGGTGIKAAIRQRRGTRQPSPRRSGTATGCLFPTISTGHHRSASTWPGTCEVGIGQADLTWMYAGHAIFTPRWRVTPLSQGVRRRRFPDSPGHAQRGIQRPACQARCTLRPGTATRPHDSRRRVINHRSSTRHPGRTRRRAAPARRGVRSRGPEPQASCLPRSACDAASRVPFAASCSAVPNTRQRPRAPGPATAAVPCPQLLWVPRAGADRADQPARPPPAQSRTRPGCPSQTQSAHPARPSWACASAGLGHGRAQARCPLTRAGPAGPVKNSFRTSGNPKPSDHRTRTDYAQEPPGPGAKEINGTTAKPCGYLSGKPWPATHLATCMAACGTAPRPQ